MKLSHLATNSMSLALQSVIICKKMDFWEDLYRAYVNLGCTYNMNGMKKEAISAFDKAIDVAERLSNKIACLCESLSWKAEVSTFLVLTSLTFYFR